MKGLYKFASFWLQNKKMRYLIAGAWNTLFGYGLMVVLFKCLSSYLHLVVIALISSFFSITVSFLSYKIFVFRTVGNWFTEWLRSFVVYGGATVFSIALLWLFIDGLDLNIYLAQGASTVLVVFASYIGHQKFTFKKNEQKIN